jgi:hypothetical protein
VDEAVGPDENAGPAWDRAVETPETGSALEFGQTLRVDFGFDDQVPDSPLETCPAWISCELLLDTVFVEAVDPSEDEEFDR